MARLALVVIARDEAAHIERLLRSVAPWVDEMLVLDTGSRDATPALAAACGARVAHFAWCEDFSAARNRALDLAAADWHLVLDADEWLIEGGPALAALRQQPPDFVGTLALDSSSREASPTAA
ncbi:UNVERIFIED_ORG: glycosyltransferase [Shinella sp. XGS7]|nr:glycosyltransferase [Shinella sp. XGS7]